MPKATASPGSPSTTTAVENVIESVAAMNLKPAATDEFGNDIAEEDIQNKV